MRIIPALLNQSTDELKQQLEKLSPYFSRFQIDIADGEFVPNKTIQIDDLPPLTSHFKHLTFDFHLMVKDYLKATKILQKVKNKNLFKVGNIFIHLSVIANNQYPITNNGPGIVLDPNDSVRSLEEKFELSKIPYIQIMSVNPGFQGSPFLPETLKKIEELRLLGYQKEIYLDGGVNLETLPSILDLKYKPDFLCMGSCLTKADNLVQRIKHLQAVMASAAAV